jgi:pimeloyl-ACP methyl ester carboxylesterase
MPPDEFVGTLLARKEANCLFVSDLKRSWMNDPEFCDELREMVHRLRAELGIMRIFTIGVSMGGFSAQVCSVLFPVQCAIAISPQYSMSREILPDETRWRYWRKRIHNPRFLSVDHATPHPRHSFLLHGAVDDLSHMRCFQVRKGLDQFVFPEHGHSNLAGYLKDSGTLPALLDASRQLDRRAFARIVRQHGAVWRSNFDDGEVNG